MSCIALPRLVFAGRVLSDVSTRNNEPSNYAPGVDQSNLWNPIGGASFEFLNCSISGFSDADTGDDPLLGARVTGLLDRPSGKMVDLDPAWQMASEIWGLGVRVTDPISGELGFQGNYSVASFRDLWARQIAELRNFTLPNGQPSGARYVSVLTDVEWGPLAERSRALTNLRNATYDDHLSISLGLFGYFYTETEPRHATGSCVGLIGPYKMGEPKTAIVSRRTKPLAVRELLPDDRGLLTRSGQLIEAIDFEVDRDALTASFDLGQALPLDSVDGPLADITALYPPFAPLTGLRLGLRPPDDVPIFSQMSADSVTMLTDLLDLSGDWYARSGGILDVSIPADQVDALDSSRVGVFGGLPDGSVVLLAEETDGGTFIRTDHFVRRMEPGDTTTVTLHARQFGRPATNLDLFLEVSPGAGLSAPEKVTTNAEGLATVDLAASDPGNPRGPLDGAIFAIGYSFRRDASGALTREGTGLGGLDVIVVHVRDAFDIPSDIDFDRDIKPIMSQYDQLYPIMSLHLFQLADREMFLRYRQALLTAFQRPIDHPNHMPVTRDLSKPKTEMILRWLQAQPASGDPGKRELTPSNIAVAALDVGDFVAAFSAADRDAKTEAAQMIADGLQNAPAVPDFKPRKPS